MYGRKKLTEFVDDNMQSFITLKLFYSQGKKKKKNHVLGKKMIEFVDGNVQSFITLKLFYSRGKI